MTCCDTTGDAARHGHLRCMKTLIEERNVQWDDDTTLVAVTYNEMDILEYIHEHECPWDPKTARATLEKNSSELAMYSLKNGAKWHAYEIDAIEKKWSTRVLYLDLVQSYQTGTGVVLSTIKSKAIKDDYVWVLKEYVRDRLDPAAHFDQEDMETALTFNSQDTIRFLLQEGCEWPEHATVTVATTGDVELLKMVRALGCPWAGGGTTMICAEEAGMFSPNHIHFMIYAIKHGCPLDPGTMLNLASHYPRGLVAVYESGTVTWDETELEGSQYDKGEEPNVNRLGCEHYSSLGGSKLVADIGDDWKRRDANATTPKPAKRQKLNKKVKLN